MKIAAESEIAEKIRNVTSEKAIKKELLLRIRQTQNQDDYDYEENRYPSGEEDNETRKGSDVAPRKSSTRGQDKKLRELPTADVKVVIKIIDSVTGKKRRLTASQVDVKEPSDVKVTLTKEVNEALHSPNHTLTLQVTCKRCKRRVHLEKLFKTSKRKNKANGLRTRRLNPNRPYLVITTNENSATENNNAKSIRDSRSKRHAPNSCPEGEYLQKFLLLGEKSDTCCSERIYVTFDQLGLDDVIIFPKGFSTVNCLGSCGRSVSALHPRTTSGDELRTADEELRRRASGETRVGDVSPGTVGNTRQCTSIQKSSLDLFYLNENNTVIPMKLDNFIDEACGCLS
ncbi:unnamed protein product [Lymnaea stagnalis]|uniref:TGF-beta family profile domain-containing protein n=1 Tax=Lymnaea stagnalis TaxID=6523 RepID=A0AAV2HCG0_LYMST